MLDQRIEGILVRARSLGGIGTTLSFPEFDWTVDLGVCTPAAIRTSTIALTHTHADHLSGLPMYLGVRRLFGMGSPRLIAPAPMTPALQSLIASLGVLQGRPFEVQVDPIRLGEDLPLASNLFLHPFGVDHPVPSVGYVLVRRVQKLREEYVGLPSDRIVRLRRERGMEIFRTVEEPLVAVTGDSTAAGMDLDDPLVARARLVFVEATFVDDQRDLAHVRAGGHARLDELVLRLQALSCGTIVLYHFSQIYRCDEVEAAVKALLPRSLAARTILLKPDEADRL